MKVTGFTFIRNAIKFDYPIVEAIKSILPLCDKFVVAVGKSEDKTLELIINIDPEKIKIIETVWDDTLREGGKVLADETNKALNEIDLDSDWCFYIQGDEVIHEKYLPLIKQEMLKYNDDLKIDGLLFNYLHFYGSYDYIGIAPNWYQNEIRIIRRNNNIYSYKDAQGFRKNNNEKLVVVPIEAYVYHYGWVKDPQTMQLKQKNFTKLWHDDKWIKTHIAEGEQYDYKTNTGALKKFKNTHPMVMKERILKSKWKFDYDIKSNKFTLKQKLKIFIQNKLGYNLSYKNFIIKR